LQCRKKSRGNDFCAGPLSEVTATVNILEKPIERIRETCEMMGATDKFDRALSGLETHLEAEIAAGETSETRLTFEGLCFLNRAFSRLSQDAP
jgi:hypothetical protein